MFARRHCLARHGPAAFFEHYRNPEMTIVVGYRRRALNQENRRPGRPLPSLAGAIGGRRLCDNRTYHRVCWVLVGVQPTYVRNSFIGMRARRSMRTAVERSTCDLATCCSLLAANARRSLRLLRRDTRFPVVTRAMNEKHAYVGSPVRRVVVHP
jgi:hypothetical protein